MMNKAQIFDISMILVVVGAMVAVLVVVDTIATETSPWQSLGQRAFEIQNAYAQADEFAAVMGMAARWASADAVLVLGKNSGHLREPACGVSKGIMLWNTPDARTTCPPAGYASFYSLLSDRLAMAGRNYAGIARIPYEFVAGSQRLHAIALAPLRVNILAPKEQEKKYAPWDIFGLWTITTTYEPHVTGAYVFRPDFEIPFAYDLGIYDALAPLARDIPEECGSLPAEEKSPCVTGKVKEAVKEQAAIAVANEGDIFSVTITQDARKSLYFDTVPIIRFALHVVPTD